MKAMVARTAPFVSVNSERKLWPIATVLFFFALLWLEVINHLKAEWSLNPQYAYGWAVPFIALYLFWRRWSDRPAPAAMKPRVGPIILIFACALLFLPIRLVAEANPDWRLLSWAFAFVAVTMSMLSIFIMGGWPWLRRFAFPVLFFLVAVPWPTQFEQAVVQNLMRAVATINVALVNLAGIPALQHGNVIEVKSGLIGIEEACSGVRSLQATLMISLFLGELYSFNVARRALLVIAGAALAFVCNVIRTAILVWVGARHGAAAIESWHDPAGLTILLVCLFGLWLLSLVLLRNSDASLQSRQIDNGPSSFNLPWRLAAVLVLWLLLAEAGVQVWYRLHQSASISSRWAVSWPASETGYKSVPIAPEAENLLHYNDGGGASWQTSDGHQWMMYFFHWLPGRTAARFVKFHRPDICLPASGMTMERDKGLTLLALNGVTLPVRSYRFDSQGTPLHVFYCYWDARSSYKNVAAAEEEDWTARGRVRAALRGQREAGAQMLEVVVWGYDDDIEAGEALRRQLAQIVTPLT
jgi:exosortase